MSRNTAIRLIYEGIKRTTACSDHCVINDSYFHKTAIDDMNADELMSELQRLKKKWICKYNPHPEWERWHRECAALIDSPSSLV